MLVWNMLLWLFEIRILMMYMTGKHFQPTKLILCPRCGLDSLVRGGPPILPSSMVFRNDTYGPTRAHAIQEIRYPVHCTTVEGGNSYITSTICQYDGSLNENDTRLLLDQMKRRGSEIIPLEEQHYADRD